MRVALLNEIPEDENLRRSWDGLVEQMERPEAFYTYEWAVAVQRAYHTSLVPLLFLLYEAETLVGLVALARSVSGEDAFFLTASTSDYCDFLSHPSRRREVVDSALAELRKLNIRTLVLANLPADSVTLAALKSTARGRGYHAYSRSAYQCARVVLGTPEQREALKRSLTGERAFHRAWRKMEKTAPISVWHDTRWDDVERTLPIFTKTHVARFLATGRISNLVRPERRAFLRELARGLAGSGCLVSSRLMIGDHPVAWNYGFQFAGSWFWYQPTFDTPYERFSPGISLLTKIVEAACDRPDINLVDLGLGAEDYKGRFAAKNRETLHVTMNTSLRLHIRAIARHQAARVATASPVIERRIRAFLGHLAKWRSRFREKGALGFANWILKRGWHSLFGRDEVLFFERPANGEPSATLSGGLMLKSLDWDHLAVGAMQYADDQETLAYLIRAAQRLRRGRDRGFVLVTSEDTPLHFCWAADFEGFELAELGRRLQAPVPDAVMIFDCWTPLSVRGHGYFSIAVTALAGQICGSHKTPWIFAASSNRPSLRGIEKAGFTYRYTLGSSRILGVNRTLNLPEDRSRHLAPSAASVR